MSQKGFAETTSVTPEKTKAEIETTLRRYGADSFVSGWDADRAFVMFKAKDRLIRFMITMPKRTEKRFTHTHTGKLRSQTDQEKEYAQAIRSYWRRLLLCIKAKLESVETGIETFEEAFLAQIVLPDQSTMGDWAKKQLHEVYTSKQMPRALLALGPAGN